METERSAAKRFRLYGLTTLFALLNLLLLYVGFVLLPLPVWMLPEGGTADVLTWEIVLFLVEIVIVSFLTSYVLRSLDTDRRIVNPRLFLTVVLFFIIPLLVPVVLLLVE